jgi:hypothetical protein
MYFGSFSKSVAFISFNNINLLVSAIEKRRFDTPVMKYIFGAFGQVAKSAY